MPIVGQGKMARQTKIRTVANRIFSSSFYLAPRTQPLILVNKKSLLNILFQSVSQTLAQFAKRRLGGTLGITAVVHTWDQTLLDHFHLHCLVPAGVLSFDRNRWVSARQDFLFPVKALSVVFRGKFLDSLKKSFDQNKLLFVGQIVPLADADAFNGLINGLRKKPWVVYAKKPFGSPAHVLDYLGRYTHRVALSNNRICSFHTGEVTFAYRDRKNRDRRKLMTLDAEEFIRRFLLHVIPKGFMRVRHYGFLANHSKDCLSKCRQLIGTYARTASTSPTLHRGVDAGLDGNRYPSLPALPERNAGVGFSAGGVSAVGFIVKIGQSIRSLILLPSPEPTHRWVRLHRFTCS